VGRGFRYGWVRGAGSAAFVLGTLLSGQLVDRFGLGCIIVTSSVLFLAMALCAARVNARPGRHGPLRRSCGRLQVALGHIGLSTGGFRRRPGDGEPCSQRFLCRDRLARAAATAAGAISLCGPTRWWPRLRFSSCLGPWLIARFGRARCAACRRCRRTSMGRYGRNDLDAGAYRRAGAARPHLRVDAPRRDGIIAKWVPERLAATAQTVYGALALGIASAVLTFGSATSMGGSACELSGQWPRSVCSRSRWLTASIRPLPAKTCRRPRSNPCGPAESDAAKQVADFSFGKTKFVLRFFHGVPPKPTGPQGTRAP